MVDVLEVQSTLLLGDSQHSPRVDCDGLELNSVIPTGNGTKARIFFFFITKKSLNLIMMELLI